MPTTIEITDQAMQALRGVAINPFRQTATKRPNGNWYLTIEDETFERLAMHRFEDETFSDTIERIIALNKGQVS